MAIIRGKATEINQTFLKGLNDFLKGDDCNYILSEKEKLPFEGLVTALKEKAQDGYESIHNDITNKKL